MRRLKVYLDKMDLAELQKVKKAKYDHLWEQVNGDRRAYTKGKRIILKETLIKRITFPNQDEVVKRAKK
jgi:hypothetical protein